MYEEWVNLKNDPTRVMGFRLQPLLPVCSRLEGLDLASRVYLRMSIVYFISNLNLRIWKKPSLVGLTDTVDHLPPIQASSSSTELDERP